jgi:hypothetical protein
MPDTKITALTALTTADPATDMFPVVDVSDTTMAASGTTKRISINNILACSPSATLASATITGALGAAGLNVTGATIPANGVYLGSANNLSFSANSTLGMTLNSTGLGVGSSPSYQLHVAKSQSSQTTVFIDNQQNNAAASSALSLSAYGGSWNVSVPHSATSVNPLIFKFGATEIARLTSVGDLVLAGGNTSANGVGVTFPATQVASSDANTLDDYKEATWSPVITAGSGTPTTVTVNSAVYTKVGRVVVCTFDFSIVNKGTASSSLQFGLPVTSITSTAFCGSFREDGSTGNMGMVIYSTGTTAGCLLYNNTTPWVDGYRLKGTYTYFAA